MVMLVWFTFGDISFFAREDEIIPDMKEYEKILLLTSKRFIILLWQKDPEEINYIATLSHKYKYPNFLEEHQKNERKISSAW